jgi:hypothetical protein
MWCEWFECIEARIARLYYSELTSPSQLKSLVVSPDPPVPGKNLTVTVEAEVLETIEVSLLFPDMLLETILFI